MNKIDTRSFIIFFIMLIYVLFINYYGYDLFGIELVDKINLFVWIFWCIMCIIFNINNNMRISKKNNKLLVIFVIISLYLITYTLLGLILGYKVNIYSNKTIIRNFLYYVLIPIIYEVIRNYLIINSRRSKVVFWCTTLLFSIIYIDLYSIRVGIDFEIISSVIIPSIFLNICLSYLTLNGGIICSITYVFLIRFYMIVIPILPKTNWFYDSLFGMVIPLLCIIFIKRINDKYDTNIYVRNNGGFIIKMFGLFLLIIFVTFIGGLYKYYPVAVLSNSMSPIYSRGDIVLVEKNIDKEINNYDIILYEIEGVRIMHRVIGVEKYNDGSIKYITKGDNNEKEDLKKVERNQIKGIIKLSIPKIGYPSIMLREIIK